MSIRNILAPVFILVFVFGNISAARSQESPQSPDSFKKEIISRFRGRVPQQWAEKVPGVKTRLDTSQKFIALTLDACGSEKDGYDTELINFLIQERVPATLFINSRWIDKNPETFKRLAANKLFEIENHGWLHRPCSAAQVKAALLTAEPGSIIICYMNHPEKETAEGMIAAVPELKKRGFRFVRLSEYNLK